MLVPVLNDYKMLYFNINNLYWAQVIFFVKKYFKLIQVDLKQKKSI